jgi:hypothetical protein
LTEEDLPLLVLVIDPSKHGYGLIDQIDAAEKHDFPTCPERPAAFAAAPATARSHLAQGPDLRVDVDEQARELFKSSVAIAPPLSLPEPLALLPTLHSSNAAGVTIQAAAGIAAGSSRTGTPAPRTPSVASLLLGVIARG